MQERTVPTFYSCVTSKAFSFCVCASCEFDQVYYKGNVSMVITIPKFSQPITCTSEQSQA